MLSLLKPRDLAYEDVKDFRYLSVSSILMPSSKILIGTAGKLEDASLFSSGDLSFDFTNGVAENGLDIGSEVPNQWYALYAVPKPGTSQYTLRASVQSPHQAGGTGPTGFAKYRYLGIFRNGVNSWSTTSSHLPGDICFFNKSKNSMSFQGFNDANGGQYPVAVRHTGIPFYMANTSPNGIVFDFDNLASAGFSGVSAYGAAKTPYRLGLYSFSSFVNVSSGTCITVISDAVGNDRRYLPMTLETSVNAFHISFDIQPSNNNYQSAIRSFHSANGNVNRGLMLNRFVDPYSVGGI